MFSISILMFKFDVGKTDGT